MPNELSTRDLIVSCAVLPCRRTRRIADRIARIGIDSGRRLEHYRWAGALWAHERTGASFSSYRRLPVCDECRADIHAALLSVA